MNEQIRELAKQAGIFYYRKGQLQGDMEKFAEVILKDMHRKVVASILITDIVMEEKGQTPTSEDYLLAINKDFGIEE